MGQVCHCRWRTCREINVLPQFEYHMFFVLYLWPTLSLPRSNQCDCLETSGFMSGILCGCQIRSKPSIRKCLLVTAVHVSIVVSRDVNRLVTHEALVTCFLFVCSLFEAAFNRGNIMTMTECQ
jgi:hypothetical protein